MADIELVIKIPEESYNILKSGCFINSGERSGKTILQQFCRAIHNGTPLPKGHGRLIDADKLDTRERGNNSQRTMWWNIDQIVRNAPTIIEADKVESEV